MTKHLKLDSNLGWCTVQSVLLVGLRGFFDQKIKVLLILLSLFFFSICDTISCRIRAFDASLNAENGITP